MEGSIATIVARHKEIRESGVPGNRPGMWMRPVSWRGHAAAIDCVDGVLCVVPRGLYSISFIPRQSDLTCAWELAEPKAVLAEGQVGS